MWCELRPWIESGNRVITDMFLQHIEEMAALIDTGYGNRNLREFVEANSSTPYKIP